MYVCICKAVTDRDIRRAAANGADSLYELQESLGVATGCGSCVDHAISILDETQASRSYASPAMYVPSAA
jgi:bacterioferritin-associated ferredoxin